MSERPIFGITPPPATLRGYRARNAAALAAGRHPLTNYPLLEGHTCRECAYCVLRGMVAGCYWKCRKGPITGGPATDLRVRWPACTLFEVRE